VIGGAVFAIVCRKPFEGLPNNVTAATRSAIAGGIGPVMPEGSVYPAGTESAVMYPLVALRARGLLGGTRVETPG
jgi:hypothetical protein